MGLVQKAKATKSVIETVPQVSIILSEWSLGIGTIIGAAIGKCSKKAYLVGLLQLILSVIIIGWIWSIFWGYFMFDKKAMKKVVQKGVQMAT